MKTLLLICFVAMTFSPAKDTRYFELRVYYAAPGKLDALITRFSDHTTRIFEKHGMQNIGYWVPVTNDKNTLYYILAYPDKDSRKKSWEGFSADAEWKDAKGKSEVNGKLVDSVKSVFMYAADILPAINSGSAGADRTFELRTYHCQPGKLPALTKRFQDHTLKLFENHGMENIAYFNSDAPEGKQPDLVYLIAHKSEDAAAKSWAAFLADPDWVKVRDASEKDGKILVGIEKVYLKPLSFSKIK
ncbi:MAG TPA: NIPSNAP family protein [Cyclobacteriaceae bacterium]|nr:NIPSNAP family protein [Cyclobacteriaceae bacterium]